MLHAHYVIRPKLNVESLFKAASINTFTLAVGEMTACTVAGAASIDEPKENYYQLSWYFSFL